MFSKFNVAFAASAASLSLAKAGKCPFGFDEAGNVSDLSKTESLQRPVVTSSDADYPSDIFTCSARNTGYGIPTTKSSVGINTYKAIVSDVITKYEAVSDEISDNSNPRATYAACLVRTAGHDFMDYRYADGASTGGADGCIFFEDGDNTGLPACLTDSGLAATYQDYCEDVSLADFLVIIAEAVMGRTADRYDSDNYYESGTVAKIFLENFKFGRKSATSCSWATGLMPNPEDGCDGLSNIFVDNIYAGTGLEWELTAAISGAHTLGGAQIANSGYDGFWADASNAGRFNNDYYKGILYKGWGVERAVNGNADKNQWKRIDGGADLTHKEFMLNTDMCLAMESNEVLADEDHLGYTRREANKMGEPLLAAEHNCCGWVKVEVLPLGEGDEYCGGILEYATVSGRLNIDIREGGDADAANRNVCCLEEDADSFGDCDRNDGPIGPAYDSVLSFATDELVWLASYVSAWGIATTNGFQDSDLWAIGSGNGLDEFNSLVDDERLANACAAKMKPCMDGPVQDLWSCLMDFVWSRVYCMSGGGMGEPPIDE